MFYFLRIYDHYMFLLNMSYKIVCKAASFFLFVGGCFIFIAKIEQSLQFGVNNPDDELKDIPNYGLRLMF